MLHCCFMCPLSVMVVFFVSVSPVLSVPVLVNVPVVVPVMVFVPFLILLAAHFQVQSLVQAPVQSSVQFHVLSGVYCSVPSSVKLYAQTCSPEVCCLIPVSIYCPVSAFCPVSISSLTPGLPSWLTPKVGLYTHPGSCAIRGRIL